MTRVIPVLVVVLVVAFIFLMMFLAWRARRNSGAHIELSRDELGSARVMFTIDDVFYVATTPVDAPYDRVSIAGLVYRGHAVISVTDTGVIIRVRGERPVEISKAALLSIRNSQLVIDKVVEPNGLVSLDWQHEQERFSTVFRVKNVATHHEFARLIELYDLGDAHAEVSSIHLHSGDHHSNA